MQQSLGMLNFLMGNRHASRVSTLSVLNHQNGLPKAAALILLLDREVWPR